MTRVTKALPEFAYTVTTAFRNDTISSVHTLASPRLAPVDSKVLDLVRRLQPQGSAAVLPKSTILAHKARFTETAPMGAGSMSVATLQPARRTSHELVTGDAIEPWVAVASVVRANTVTVALG